MSCDPSRICRHCSMFACGEATDPSEMCREAILERLATAEAASRPVFSRRLLEARLAASEARAEKAISDTVQEFGLRRAAEARVAEVESKFTVVDNLRTSADRALYAERVRVVGLEARVRALEEAARDMCREWRLHGQLTDSARPMERLLGIHAPFCPIHSGNDCECDIALTPPPEAEKRGGGMSDESKCSYCECVLSIGGYQFVAHTDEFCRRGTLYRIENLTRMLTKQFEETAILRGMMARHVCAAPLAAEGKEEER